MSSRCQRSYPHRAALAQYPVRFDFNGEIVSIYPLRLRDLLDMDMWLQDRFVAYYEEQALLLPEKDREEFLASIAPTADNITFQQGLGYDVFSKDIDAMTHFISLLLRSQEEWSESRIKERLSLLTLEDAFGLTLKMRQAVWREVPEQAELKIKHKPPKYMPTNDEMVARVYHSLADKFHWGYNVVLDLTEYQVAWYLHMYPEEREHIEELDSMANKTSDTIDNSAPPPLPPEAGKLHFDTVEEFEAWRVSQQKEKD